MVLDQSHETMRELGGRPGAIDSDAAIGHLEGPTPSPRRAEPVDLEQVNRQLSGTGAPAIVRWAADTYADGLAMSTSFGIQSAVVLHLVTREIPGIPVVWVDTGYLPPDTYRYAELLSRRLALDLRVYQSPMSPGRMEALHGRLWERDDVEALDLYDEIRKVEPMRRALDELGARAWIAGLRAEQTEHRSTLPLVGEQWERHKVLPILDWSAKDVYEYLRRHDLPFHPLYDEGYTTVGDWHSSRPAGEADLHERQARFRGLKQECGLHLSDRTETEARDRRVQS